MEEAQAEGTEVGIVNKLKPHRSTPTSMMDMNPLEPEPWPSGQLARWLPRRTVKPKKSTQVNRVIITMPKMMRMEEKLILPHHLRIMNLLALLEDPGSDMPPQLPGNRVV